jgi:hypothetical protein
MPHRGSSFCIPCHLQTKPATEFDIEAVDEDAQEGYIEMVRLSTDMVTDSHPPCYPAPFCLFACRRAVLLAAGHAISTAADIGDYMVSDDVCSHGTCYG